jgi:hypothetical protein
MDALHNNISIVSYDESGYLVTIRPGVLCFTLNRVLYTLSENGVLLSRARLPGIPTGLSVDGRTGSLLVSDLNGFVRIYKQ